MRRKRFNDFVGACVSPDMRAKLEDVAERRLGIARRVLD